MMLYHSPYSHNARRAVAVARHVGADVELVTVDLGKGEQRGAGFLALNPNGKVPALVDGDFVLWESTAIMGYLATKAGSSLVPTSARDRADVDRWLAWSSTRFGSAAGTFLYENLVKSFFGIGAPDEAALARATPEVEACFDILEKTLSSHPYLAACGLTIADFAAYSLVESRALWKLPAFGARPALERWAAAMAALPAWAR